MIYPWQTSVWQRLLAWRRDAPHAILLAGPAGIGKLQFARELARFWLCETPLAEGACGVCPSCRFVALHHHPDLILIRPEAVALIEGAEGEDETQGEAGDSGEAEVESDRKATRAPSREIRIGQIQTLNQGVNIGTQRQGRRLVLVYPAESMNVFTANALLKLLEEPPPHNHLILVSDSPERLLATIRSRCQQVNLPPPPADLAERWLIENGVADASMWLAEAGGAPLAALRAAHAEAPVHEARSTLFEGLAAGVRFDALQVAEKLARADRTLVVAWLQRWVWDCLGWRVASRIRYYPSHKTAIAALARQFDVLELARFSRELGASRRFAEHPLNARLFFEDLLLRYAHSVAPRMGSIAS